MRSLRPIPFERWLELNSDLVDEVYARIGTTVRGGKVFRMPDAERELKRLYDRQRERDEARVASAPPSALGEASR